MASKEKLAEWLYDNRKQLQLKAKIGEWVKDWLPGFEDIRVQLQINNKVYEGSGIAKDQEMAFLIAGAEAIERAYCDNLGINSNGVALHTTEELAILNAKLELIERDGFLCHFLTKAPFADLKVPNNFDIDFEQIKNKLEKQDVEISLKRVAYSSPQIVVCIARKLIGQNSFNCILGLGSHENPILSITKAITECLCNVVWMLNSHDNNAINFEDFEDKTDHRSIDHQKLYKGNNSELNLDWIFYGKNSKSPINFTDDIKFITLKTGIPILESAPITVARATSTEVQNIFYGLTTIEKINLQRLNKFNGSKIDKTKINWMPHPIG